MVNVELKIICPLEEMPYIKPRPKMEHIPCECGQDEHIVGSKHCGDCGRKLEKTAVNGSL